MRDQTSPRAAALATLQVRVVVVPKRVTALLLVLVSAAMLALVYFLSGKVYVLDSHPAAEIVRRLLRRDEPSRVAILVALMPVIANALFFVPWGFLTFIVLDRPRRRRLRTYITSVVAARPLTICAVSTRRPPS